MKGKSEYLLIAGITFLSPFFSFGQNTERPLHKNRPPKLETSGDSYLPNGFNNKKTSPSYISANASVRNTSIFTMQVNVDSDGQNILGDAANEPNIAVNPQNKNEIVIGWRQFDNVSSNFRQAGWSYTSDGGLTWTFPGVIQPGIFRSDPVLDFDSAGNFYYNSLTVDNFGNYVCKVFRSTNGGSSWDDGTDAHGGDKQWMTIDRTTGVGSGNIYAFWTSAYSSCYPNFFTRSTDEGDSYEDCNYIDGDPFWGTMAVGKDGELYIVGGGDNYSLVVAKSLTAQDPTSAVTWDAPVQVYIDGYLGFGGNVNPGGLLGQSNIDVDRSDGPYQGNVYVLASVTRAFNGDPGDIMFSKSTDGGTAWSQPIKINDDASTSNYQWLGAMSVAPNGRIDAVWLDTRDASDFTDSSALYYSYSLDGGDTWSVNERLSDLFNPHVGYPNQNKMGDYFDMVSDSTSAHLAWANTLNGEEDVYYSRITPQIFTSVNQSADAGFSVTPNPTTGVIAVTTPSLTGINSSSPSQIKIYNEFGQEVYSKAVLKSKSEIDISSEPAGIYFLKIVDQQGNSVAKKLIKE